MSVALIDQDLEDRILRAVLHYPDIMKMVRGKLREEAFSTASKAALYRCIAVFWDVYSRLPNEDEMRLVISEVCGKGTPRARLAGAVYDKVIGELEPPSRDWIISKIDVAVKSVQLQKALFQAKEKLASGNYTAAEAELVRVIRTGGVVSSKAEDDIAAMTPGRLSELALRKDNLCCPTRVVALDNVVRGFFRKQLFVLMAPLSVGKSWFALHSAQSALFSGRHVLYFTLEMSKEDVLQRFSQQISGAVVPFRDDEVWRAVKSWDATFKQRSVDERAMSLLQASKVHKHWRALERFGGKIWIKEFPTKTATLSDIEHNVNIFDMTFGKKPDFVIVDGLLNMKTEGGKDATGYRIELGEITAELRRIAGEYDLAVLLTHQANRLANVDKQHVDVEHTGESIDVLRVADTGVSLMQTNEQARAGVSRLWVMRSRGTEKKRGVIIHQNFETGQFCLFSEDEADHKKRMRELEEKAGGGKKESDGGRTPARRGGARAGAA